MKKDNKNYMVYNRIRGALAGVAVGDALGAPLEFMSAEAIEAKHGKVTEMIGGGWLNVKPGETTDDTAMTLAVAQGIAENPENPVVGIGRRFIEWMESGPKDIGSTCHQAIYLARKAGGKTAMDWGSAGKETRYIMKGINAGNGALMRTVYTGIFYAKPTDRANKTAAIAQMTHYNEESTTACQVYADAIHKAIFGGEPSLTIPKQYKQKTEPTGYVLDSMCCAVRSVVHTWSFEEAVVNAVNRGGDADTIGAIAGGLAGAYYGYDAIPERWLKEMDPELLKEIDRLADIAYSENERYYKGTK